MAETDAKGWRLIVRGQLHASGVDRDDLTPRCARSRWRPRLARDAFGVGHELSGAWEDEYTEEHGEDALTFEDWMERIETGLPTSVDVDGTLYTASELIDGPARRRVSQMRFGACPSDSGPAFRQLLPDARLSGT